MEQEKITKWVEEVLKAVPKSVRPWKEAFL